MSSSNNRERWIKFELLRFLINILFVVKLIWASWSQCKSLGLSGKDFLKNIGKAVTFEKTDDGTCLYLLQLCFSLAIVLFVDSYVDRCLQFYQKFCNIFRETCWLSLFVPSQQFELTDSSYANYFKFSLTGIFRGSLNGRFIEKETPTTLFPDKSQKYPSLGVP